MRMKPISFFKRLGELSALLALFPAYSFAQEAVKISPSGTVDFGEVEVGKYKEITFTVTPIGSSAYIFVGTSTTWWLHNLSAPFWHVGGSCSGGKKITKSSGGCTIIIRFTPREEKEYADSDVKVYAHRDTSNLGGAHSFAVLRGRGRVFNGVWDTAPGECTGGTGEPVVGEWFPTSGCGLTTQTRSVMCMVNESSGIQPTNVFCKSTTNGSVLAESECNPDTRPPDFQACTPSPDTACGVLPPAMQQVHLKDECSENCVPDPKNNRYCIFMPL